MKVLPPTRRSILLQWQCFTNRTGTIATRRISNALQEETHHDQEMGFRNDEGERSMTADKLAEAMEMRHELQLAI